jgi:hypothetical protein
VGELAQVSDEDSGYAETGRVADADADFLAPAAVSQQLHSALGVSILLETL